MPPKADTDTAMENPTVQDEVDTLKADLLRLKDDIALIADSMRNRATSRARDTRDMAQARYEDSMDSFEAYIEEKPITTVLMAFGIGLLVGKIFSMK